MRSILTRVAAALAATATTASLGVALGFTTAPARAASAVTGATCDAPSRIFQLRDRGTEVWMSSVSRAHSADPQVYSWRKVYDISGARGTALTAHTEGDHTIQVLLSQDDGSLRSLVYNKAEATVTYSRLLARSGWRYTSLASDGRKMWGIRGGNLHVMSGISTDAVPSARSTVRNVSGLWPSAFYANPQGTYDLAWTNGEGVLSYADIGIVDGRWTLRKRTTVATGWGSHAITSPGAGIVLRASSTNLLRHVIDTSAPKAAWAANLDTGFRASHWNPMSTVPDTCRTKPTDSNQIIGDVYQSSVNVPCHSKTRDLGVHNAYSRGTAVKMRMCAIPGFKSTSQESTPGSAYYVSGANGDVIVSSRAAGAMRGIYQRARSQGVTLKANSSFRTMAHQRALCQANTLCRNGNYTYVARPGYSNHQLAVAVDFAGTWVKGGGTCSTRARDTGSAVWRFLENNARDFGYKQYSAESWHWDPTPLANRC